MARKFEQTLHQDKENTKVVAIGQTRDGIDEWITPVAIYERSSQTGIYYPAGLLEDKDVSKFRVELTFPKMKALFFEQISVDNITHLNPNMYQNARRAKIEVRNAQISYRIDGGAPTKGYGHFLGDGDILTLDSPEDIERFTAININSPAVLAVTYFVEVISNEN